MDSAETTQSPQPVSSLRSRFEKMAATPPPVPPLGGPGGPRVPARARALSNADLKDQQQFLDPKRIVSGPSDGLNVPVLRASPSFPDLKGSGKMKPAPPPPRGSRTPSPQPPSLAPSANSSPSHTMSPSISRRPPPPPPPPRPPFLRAEGNTGVALQTGTDTYDDTPVTPTSGGVASLRSKFKDGAFSPSSPASETVGNGYPTYSPRHKNSRSVSTIISPSPPAIPARLTSGAKPPAKGPRASLPSISSICSDPSPLQNSSSTLSESSSPLIESPVLDSAYLLSRQPPPIPSRSNIDLLAKAANTVVQHQVQWGAEAEAADNHRHSSESASSLESETGACPPTVTSRRMPPPPPVSSSPVPRLPPRPIPNDETGESPSNGGKPRLPDRRPAEPVASPPPIPASTRPSRLDNIIPPPSRAIDGITPPPTRVTTGVAPPPGRFTGSGNRPPLRRRSSGNSSSEDEEDPALSRLQRTLEDLPDSTHCCRKAPVAPDYKFANARIHVPVPSGAVAVAGQYVVVAGHHHDFRVYDLSIGDAPVLSVDLKDLAIDWRIKDPRITAMEFRQGESEESGRYLWCGSKDGNVWEYDIVRGSLVRVRPAAHMHAVVHIMRHGRSMITLDDSGKALVWKDYQDLMAGGQPRIVRTADKQGFVKLFGGLLWTSHGPGGGSHGTQRGPPVRVYDVMSPNCTSKIIQPPELLGAVTSGAILPSQPHLVYLGHEGGYITCWSLQPSEGIVDTFDSGKPVPACVQVVKISVSDVLALEGIVDRLWVGSRKGTITTYDVKTKPWTITNAWQAHGDLPVIKIFMDPFSIPKSQRMHVISLGRDEQIHFWDGLLGVKWVDGELQKREAEFSTFRDINVLMCSWNIDAQKPEALTGTGDTVNFLENVLHSVDTPDIIVFGFQEVIDLESKSLTAKAVLLGNQKKKPDGVISEKVSRSYRMWHERLVQAVRIAMPVDDPYIVVHTDNLVGIFSCIFVRQRQKHLLRDSAITTVKRGLGGRYGNKGAIVARFVVDDSSLCFINCHLAAGQSHTRSRNQDLTAILEDGTAMARSEIPEALSYVGGGDGTMILDHEICFLGGDLNYRIDLRREAIIGATQSGDLDFLLHHDQLRKQAKNNPGFRLRDFTEAPITFLPTYKYDRRSNSYDTSEKARAPAWCDRILYRCRDPSRVKTLHYKRYEANVSDHRPISAGFRVTVKSIQHERRAVVKMGVQNSWRERELGLLFQMQDFFLKQHLL